MRIIIAGIVGGLIVFIASAAMHMSPAAQLKGLPNEAQTLDQLRASVPDSGMYIFPFDGAMSDETSAAYKAWEANMKRGPYGILVVTVGGTELMYGPRLLIELGTSIVAAMLAAWVLSLIGGAYFTRVMVIVTFALFTWLSLSVSYWNWYKFPTTYTLTELVMELVAWFLAGLAIAKIVRPRVAVAL